MSPDEVGPPGTTPEGTDTSTNHRHGADGCQSNGGQRQTDAAFDLSKYRNPDGGQMSERHARRLAERSISPEFAAMRGYETVVARNRLKQLGFSHKACRRVPGLLIPLRDKRGAIWGYMFRPDDPIDNDGKTVKYVFPNGQRNGLDIPPGVGEIIGNPEEPLWITEGTLKADTAVVHGLPRIISVAGVWNWRGGNPVGGNTALSDWDDVALNGEGIVAYDGDVARKPQVRAAMDRLANYLSYRGSQMRFLHLPDTEEKTGLDDWLISGGHVDQMYWEMVRPEPPPLSGEIGNEEHDHEQKGPEEEPPPFGSIDGAAVLDKVEAWFRRFIRVTFDYDYHLLALWTVHTHLAEECRTTPRLQLDSMVEGAGKTTVLDHLKRLCHDPVLIASLSSPAVLPRMLNKGLRTILLDEVHRTLNSDKQGIGDLVAIINTGYRVGASRPVTVPVGPNGWEVVDMPTFAPAALAGNDPNLENDTRSRMIRVLLMPDLEGTVEDSDWEYLEDEAAALQEEIALWAASAREVVRGLRVELPAGCVGRSKEKWRPLKRIAVAAGGRWEKIADELIENGLQQEAAAKEAGLKKQPPTMVLLTDLHAVWPTDTDFMPTLELVDLLVAHNPGYWGETSPYGKRLTEHRLGQMLNKATNSTSTRPGGHGQRGYTLSAVQIAWTRLQIGDGNPHMGSGRSAQSAQSEHGECSDLTDLTDLTDSKERTTPCADGFAEPPLSALGKTFEQPAECPPPVKDFRELRECLLPDLGAQEAEHQQAVWPSGNGQRRPSDPCNPRQRLPAKKQPGRRARRKAKRR
jgi:hypothetical protein